MTCAEFKEMVWAYALDALDPAERQACEEHLSSPGPHQGCREQLVEALRLVPRLGAALPRLATPDPLWKKVEAQISGVTVLRPRSAARSWAPWALAAMALVACTVAILRGISLRDALSDSNRRLERAIAAQSELGRARNELERCAQDLAAVRNQADLQRAAFALLELPATKLVPLGPPSGSGPGRGSALLNLEQQKAIVLASALQPQVGKDYELWLIRGDVKVAAGLLHPGSDGRILVPVDPKLLSPGRPDAIAVTLEPEGGSAAPTGPIVLVGTVAKM